MILFNKKVDMSSVPSIFYVVRISSLHIWSLFEDHSRIGTAFFFITIKSPFFILFSTLNNLSIIFSFSYSAYSVDLEV